MWQGSPVSIFCRALSWDLPHSRTTLINIPHTLQNVNNNYFYTSYVYMMLLKECAWEEESDHLTYMYIICIYLSHYYLLAQLHTYSYNSTPHWCNIRFSFSKVQIFIDVSQRFHVLVFRIFHVRMSMSYPCIEFVSRPALRECRTGDRTGSLLR